MPEFPPLVISGLGIYGDGSDGPHTVAADENLVRDMYYTNLTINNTFHLYPCGFRIFCTGILTNNGIIDNRGGDGGNAVSGVAGSPGLGAAAGSLGGGSNGAAGVRAGVAAGYHTGSGGGGGGGGVIFIAAYQIINNGEIYAIGGKAGNGFVEATNAAGSAIGNNGVASANSLGGSGGIAGDTTLPGAKAGGAGGIATAPVATETGFRSLPFSANLRLPSTGVTIKGGSGGGSGAAAQEATLNACAAGSGGGGGGLVILIYSLLTLGFVSVLGGALSLITKIGTGAGTSAYVGNDGTVILIKN